MREDPSRLTPLLLPQPRSVEPRLGDSVAVPDLITVHGARGRELELALGGVAATRVVDDAAECWLWCQLGEVEGAESYTLTIKDRPEPRPCAHILAADRAGLRHGLRTLAQLIAQYGARLPGLRIADRPAFATRGVMLDVSRNRVPTMEHLLAVVDQLAAWKINHLQLYTEHAFAYAGHDEVWRDVSPLTPDEVRTLDERCREQGIELAANQNCFGHLAEWLRHPRYLALAEIPCLAGPGAEWDFNGLATRTGPFSLCPSDPGALALVEDLLGQLLPCFSSGLVNIGCDETFDLGQGRSREEVARRGRAAVYLSFVSEVCAVARRHGKRPMFWADIALEHPEHLQQLPEDLIGLAWGYEPDADFARWCRHLREAGREAWVCPGTSSWRSIVGRTAERRANQLAAARGGLEAGARGYLITDWGDLGHRQQWPVALHAIAEGAHRAWSGEDAYDPRASALHAFADRTLGLGAWLDALGDVDRELREISGRAAEDGSVRRLRNSSALFVDLHIPLWEKGHGTQAHWKSLLERMNTIAEGCRPLAGRNDLPALLRRELLHTVEVAHFAALRGYARRTQVATKDEERRICRDLGQRMREITANHRGLWLARSRPGGLDASCRHYEAVARELESA